MNTYAAQFVRGCARLPWPGGRGEPGPNVLVSTTTICDRTRPTRPNTGERKADVEFQAKFAERGAGIGDAHGSGRRTRANSRRAGAGGRSCQRPERRGGRAGSGQGHRHPPRHRERDRGQAELHVDRRSDLGRRHRQAARPQHRRIDRAIARPDRAARRRSRLDHPDPRPRRRFRHHAAQRPRAGQRRPQPRRRVRPVPVRADQRRRGLQDARRFAGRPGPLRHRRFADGASAVVPRSRDFVQLARRRELARRTQSGLRR